LMIRTHISRAGRTFGPLSKGKVQLTSTASLWLCRHDARIRATTPIVSSCSARQQSMKRQASSAPAAPSRSKKPRPQVPDYHLTPSRKNDDGSAIWPAPEEQIERAREFILEWYARPTAVIRSIRLFAYRTWKRRCAPEDSHCAGQGRRWSNLRRNFAKDAHTTWLGAGTHRRPHP